MRVNSERDPKWSQGGGGGGWGGSRKPGMRGEHVAKGWLLSGITGPLVAAKNAKNVDNKRMYPVCGGETRKKVFLGNLTRKLRVIGEVVASMKGRQKGCPG